MNSPSRVLVARNAVVDKGIEDWLEERKDSLKKKYSEIFQVGAHELLDERANDDVIARFCRDNDCDLFTPDMKFYEGFFKAEVKTLRVTNYDWWKKKYILLIEIAKSK